MALKHLKELSLAVKLNLGIQMIIRNPIHQFLFLVCTNPENAWISKNNYYLPSISEVENIIEVCKAFLDTYSPEEIDKLNQEQREADKLENENQSALALK